MKTKLLLFSCLGSLLLSACSSNNEPGTPPAGEVKATKVQMVVPVGCQSVRVDYPTASGVQSITADIAPVANVVPGRDVSPITNANLDIVSPVATYVNIYDEDGNPLVENFPIPASANLDTKVAVAVVKLPETAVNEYITADGPFTFYHSSGVVMFDDGWPNSYTVDGDFNDVVVDYDIEAKTVDAAVAPNQTWRECMKVVMHLRAIGGGHPSKVGLILEGLDTRYIDSYECKLTLGNWNENIPAKSLSATVDITGTNPIITLNNLNWMILSGALNAQYVNSKTGQLQPVNKASNGASFYNVADGYMNTGGDLFTLTVTFRGKDRSTISKTEGDAQVANYISAVMNTESQNFFLRTSDVAGANETHMKGYQPTSTFAPRYAEVSALGVAKDNSTTYCAQAGYVWGFKTPVMTRHAWEKTSFYKAYPEYTGWVTSAGAANAEWYKHPDMAKVVTWW